MGLVALLHSLDEEASVPDDGESIIQKVLLPWCRGLKEQPISAGLYHKELCT